MYTEWPTAYHLVKVGETWKILVIVLRYEAPRETAMLIAALPLSGDAQPHDRPDPLRRASPAYAGRSS